MKTLIVSIYDGGWGGFSAASYSDDYTVSDIEFNRSMVDIFDKVTGWGSLNSYEEEKYQDFIKDYDKVIICNNGGIKLVK